MLVFLKDIAALCRKAACISTKLLFPPVCLLCDKKTLTYNTMCTQCWQQLKFVNDPTCYTCGLPLPVFVEHGCTCLSCQQHPICNFNLIPILHYDDISKKLILPFKHGGKTYIGQFFTNIIMQKCHKILKKVDIICPVPIHTRRLLHRTYNQAAIIVNNLDVPQNKKIVDLFLKTRNTASQNKLNNKERQNNIKGSISINPKYMASVKGKVCTIIDDVYASGATIKFCNNLLQKAQAKFVYGITVAKVINN